nr:major head protein [Microvirus sp.]
MNRNTEAHFAQIPHADISRSKFYRNSDHKTTFNAGQLIPIYIDEVLPGDTHQMDMSALVRMSTPIFPTMDNLNVDYYFFFVPNRLVWNHWKEFMGENTQSYWAQTVEYQIPQISTTTEKDGLSKLKGCQAGSLLDYFGIPTGIDELNINALPIRAYQLIWNEWFRDQNTQQPCEIPKDETTIKQNKTKDNKHNTGEAYETMTKQYVTLAKSGYACLPVNKYHDYFTSCLPQPQKGEPVLMPLNGLAPVGMYETADGSTAYSKGGIYMLKRGNAISTTMGGRIDAQVYKNNKIQYPVEVNGYDDIASTGKDTSGYLLSDLGQTSGVTINQLRQAFQIQKLLERDARGGTRYTELLKAHFNVTSPDSRQQRPEYLGGYRMPITINQVVQQSETTKTSPQGNTAAFSVSSMNRSMFTKSFTEHGYIIGLAAVRTEHTYQQGIERLWSRKNRYDFYWPELANIGEQAVLNKEIYAQGTDADEEAFGYQEAWADYRYKPSRVSGDMRSTYAQTLDSWHYADYYKEQPKLSSQWMMETSSNIDRTLAVQSSVEDQFIADFYFRAQTTRPMPVYSTPGLIDHH